MLGQRASLWLIQLLPFLLREQSLDFSHLCHYRYGSSWEHSLFDRTVPHCLRVWQTVGEIAQTLSILRHPSHLPLRLMRTAILHCKCAPLIYSTVKPLYSEQSRDPNKYSLYGGVHPRGVGYVHADMCLNYNVQMLKLFRPC